LNLEKFFEEIKLGLPTSFKVFQKTSLADEEGQLRSVDEAKIILDAIIKIVNKSQELLKEYPYLETLYEKDFGPLKDLAERESIMEICFLDDYLFPSTESCPFPEDQVITNELIENYALSFDDWCAEKIKRHLSSQETIKERFSLEMKPSECGCQCTKCSGDFRAKIRDTIFKEQTD
jgi:hypothetical protein